MNEGGFTVPAQAFNVNGNDLTYIGLYFGKAGSFRHAAWQIRHIRGVISFCFFNHDGVTHFTSLETRLLLNTVQSARR